MRYPVLSILFLSTTIAFAQITNSFPDNGNVGIGTTSPLKKLHVAGDILSNKLLLNDPNTTTDWNTIWQSGFYQSYNAANAPETGQWFWGVNLNHGSNNSSYRYNGQIVIKNSSATPSMYYRSTNVSGIGTWAKVLSSIGSQKISSENTSFTIEGTGTGSYQGAFLALSALGTDSANEHASTWFMTHRGTDGVATIEFQRRNINGAYRGSPLRYRDGSGWRFDVASSKTSQGMLVGLRINSQGDVGIGTTTPDAKLAVKGNIHAEEVKVDLSVPGPDYVFKEGYDLKSLEEVQNYIKAHGHLPNIPSAKAMEANGIDLGEMNIKLLEKIEELTLYTLEQEKEISEQRKLLKNKDRKITEIENRLQKIEQLLNHQ